ncbi:MAG TPA: TIGR03087 family PEP-CTERM/XrtA system glycosyltransferase [Rhizomicrobium sp.]|nr:TIGR03087 family PEP-CTERM/XrtA system glycosyltransferase [Rhizomicrobium sp.]
MTSHSLFLSHRLPYPPNKGDKIRSHALLRHLAARGPVHLACFIDDKDDLQHLDTVRALAGGECYFEPFGAAAKMRRSLMGLITGQPLTTACFGSARLKQWVDRTLDSLPIRDLLVFGSAMAPYLLETPAASRVLFDMVDIDSDKWRQYAQVSRGGLKWLYGREAEKLERLECAAASAFGHTILASEFEAETFRHIAPQSAAKISGLANGVDLEGFTPSARQSPFSRSELPIVMTGRMDYRPNHEGAVWFAREVFPRVLQAAPQAKVYFVGSGPPAALRAVADSRTVVTGAVADVRPYLQYARAVIAPLHIARGIQNKVLEAMAMAKPLVATREATRALDTQAGVHLWVENEPARFADAVVEALTGPQRETVAQNARHYVEQHHDWSRLLKDADVQLAALNPPSPSLACARPRPAAGPALELSPRFKS